MSQFRVYAGPGRRGLYLDVQTDYLTIASTRAVVPLLDEGALDAIHPRLNPTFLVGERSVAMATQLIVSINSSQLTAPVADLTERADDITRALDMLFQGF